MPEQSGVQVTLNLSASTADLLSALTDPVYDDLEAVLMKLVDHARQGVQRPGSWEREWLCSAFGYDWPERLERDPDVPHHDRVRSVNPSAEPVPEIAKEDGDALRG